MQTLTEKVLELAPPGGLFDTTVVRNLFAGSSEGARKTMLHRAVRSGEVLRLRPGLYCLASKYRRTSPHPFTVASLLHYPSHVSLESALSHHGLIPEAVRVVASVSRERSRTFSNQLGEFTFTRVPTSSARIGVEAVRMGEEMWAFVATPLRALADLVYLRGEVSWKRDGLRFLIDSMRIDSDDLAALPWGELDEILDGFTSRRTAEYLRGARRGIGWRDENGGER